MADSIETAERYLRASGVPVTGGEIRAWLDARGIPVMVGVWPLFAAIRQAVITAGDAGHAAGVAAGRRQVADLADYVRIQHQTLGLHDHMGANLSCHGCMLLAAEDGSGSPSRAQAAERPPDLWLGPSRRDTVRLADLDLQQGG